MARAGDGWSATVNLATGDYDFPTGVQVQEIRIASAGLTAGTGYWLRMQRWDGSNRDHAVYVGDVLKVGGDNLRRIRRVGTDALLHANLITATGYYVQAT